MDLYEVLEILKKKFPFHFEIDENRSNNDYSIVRANIRSDTEVVSLVTEIEKITTSKFIIFFQKSCPTKMVYHGKWVCHRSRHRKRKNSKRAINCHVFIDVLIKKVNKDTIRNDTYLKGSNPLQCVIRLNLQHTHSTSDADDLRMLSVSSEVKKQFEEYFDNGMSVSEARRLHESKVIVKSGYSLLANAAHNPTQSQAYYLHSKWRDEKGSEPCEPFEKLLEKLPKYESKGVTIRFDGMQPSVLVVTSIMRRVQTDPSSQEVIFVDSTRSFETLGYSVTVLLTATKAGAIPIAVIFHQNQMSEGYQNAFALLKEAFPLCFGGKEAPDIFITDNLSTMKNALKNVWGSSRQLLSQFHVGHAEWRWLMSANSGVQIGDCNDALEHFEAVMFADNELKLQKAKENILVLHDKFPAFVTRFENLFKRKEEWVSLYRLNCFAFNNNIYSFCETTIRILKEVIFNRTKALKIVALVEFCIAVWDVYLRKKLLEYSHNQIAQLDILYYALSSKMTETSADVQQIDDCIYLVPSCSQSNCRYIVDTVQGYCTCSTSKTGAFCKHQYLLIEESKLHMPDPPVLSTADRYCLETLALGEKCSDDFLDFNKEEMNTDDDKIIEHHEQREANEIDYDCVQHIKHTSGIEIAMQREKSNFLNEIVRISKFDIDSTELAKLTNYLSKITDSTQLNHSLMHINKSLSLHESGKSSNINVQPLAVNGRPSLTRGS